MSVIAALFTQKGIAVATDSLLTAVGPSGGHIYLEWEQSKIISIPKLKACISYWGLAGTVEEVPQPEEKPKWIWQTYDWLQKQSANPKYDNLEDFSKAIQEQLDDQLSKLSFSRKTDKGIGLHIAGLEQIDGYMIPELFLVCNYTDPSYQKVGDLNYSRNTYHIIANCPPSPDHGKKDCRFKVRDH